MELEKESEYLTNKYQKKTDKQHVLDAPDTYIGSIESTQDESWILSHQNQFILKPVTFIPGLYHLFDEALVNCRDHVIRMKKLIASKEMLNEVNKEIDKKETTQNTTEINTKKRKRNETLQIHQTEKKIKEKEPTEKEIEEKEPTETEIEEKEPREKNEIEEKENERQHYPVTQIRVQIDQSIGKIELFNDGDGIDIAIHPIENVYIPELIFGCLRTSTNYDKKEEKLTGGKNGFGVKLIFIWSKWGKIETIDHIRCLKYSQEFTNNLDIIHPPKITKIKPGTKPFTRLSFIPDYNRLGIPEQIHPNFMKMLEKRSYDLAGITDKKVSVWFNNEKLSVKTFPQYVELYTIHSNQSLNNSDCTTITSSSSNEEEKEEEKVEILKSISSDHQKNKKLFIHESFSERWEYAIALSPFGHFTSISFVNGIYTKHGGKHVDYITNQIVRKIVSHIELKKKVVVNSSVIKEQLMLFLRCDIVNPSFDSQTKDRLDTPFSKFGSECIISDKFITKILEMGVAEMACRLTEAKVIKQINKDTNVTKSKRPHILKLYDASLAGTKRSMECTLCLTEGDGAASALKSGLIPSMLQTIGILPLRGKGINVKDMQISALQKNEEFKNIIETMGLVLGKQYLTWQQVENGLRYGSITIVSDQDRDGSHIRGLIINLIHTLWPSLFRLNGFIRIHNTPIIKITKNQKRLYFYTPTEFEIWQQKEGKGNYDVKYCKGLGTSDSTDFLFYMRNPKTVSFKYLGSTSDNYVDLLFNKKRSDDRKEWITTTYDPSVCLEVGDHVNELTYDDFFQKEMIHYSNMSNERCLPHLLDGLKPSLRKILFSAFLKNLKQDMKVCQFAGYVAEKSDYHHGEISLNTAIVGMAQDYVGSNNINYLYPSGQFGTRLQGGKDAAPTRYIFTRLMDITRTLFCIADEDYDVLKFQISENMQIEPEYYLPILPTILINGSSGIGTGFATDIPCFHPMDIFNYIRNKINDSTKIQNDNDQEIFDQSPSFVPYYEGFKGTVTEYISKNERLQYLIKGLYQISEDRMSVIITELPVGCWVTNYMEKCIEPGIEKGIFTNQTRNESLNSRIYIHVYFHQRIDEKMMEGSSTNSISLLEKILGITTTISMENMWLHNPNGKLQKYDGPEEIIEAFIPIRLKAYEKRKYGMLMKLEKQKVEAKNRARFITEVISEKIKMSGGRKQKEVEEELMTKQFDKINDSFDYLLNMKVSNMFIEQVDKLNETVEKIITEIEKIEQMSAVELWNNDLDIFKEAYQEYKIYRYRDNDELSELSSPNGGFDKITKKNKKRVKK